MSTQQGIVASLHHVNSTRVKGMADLLFGLLIGVFWIWGNLVQIQTSEAWILGQTAALSASPNLQIFLQIGQVFSGGLGFKTFISYTYGWMVQIILLSLSIGAEIHFGGKVRRGLYVGFGLFFVVLNALADINTGNVLGDWQAWAFAGVCLMASFGFGLVAIGLILTGIKRLIFGK